MLFAKHMPSVRLAPVSAASPSGDPLAELPDDFTLRRPGAFLKLDVNAVTPLGDIVTLVEELPLNQRDDQEPILTADNDPTVPWPSER
ncbi:hypothetical protein [Corallococcus terminator]|nr:hypothetical protein [Corallococcus terminator]